MLAPDEIWPTSHISSGLSSFGTELIPFGPGAPDAADEITATAKQSDRSLEGHHRATCALVILLGQMVVPTVRSESIFAILKLKKRSSGIVVVGMEDLGYRSVRAGAGVGVQTQASSLSPSSHRCFGGRQLAL